MRLDMKKGRAPEGERGPYVLRMQGGWDLESRGGDSTMGGGNPRSHPSCNLSDDLDPELGSDLLGLVRLRLALIDATQDEG